MSALKEFANFITLNMANLATTYAEYLEEAGEGYDTISADRRVASARRLLKAAIEAYESETSDPLCRLFAVATDDGPRRWAKDITPPQPLLEVECLGQTLVPVVTNLEASKFLWQILSEARATVLQSIEETPPAPQIPVMHEEKKKEPQAVKPLLVTETMLDEENLLRVLLDNLSDYIYVKDTESRFVIGNTAVALMCGAKSSQELIGKTDLDFYPQALAERYRADELAIIDSGQPLMDSEEPIVDAEGNEIWVSTTKVPLQDSQGNIFGIIGIGRDITERKRLEQQIKELPECRTEGEYERVAEQLPVSEARIRDLLISTDEAVMLLDEKGFIDCNEATLRIFGYTSKDQFINTHPSEQSPPQQPDGQDSWTVANENIAKAYREGSHRFEWFHCRADGTPFPAEVALTALDLAGKQILQAVVRDNTAYKQAQETLERERTLLRTLIDNVPDLIYVKDAESRFLISNDANARLMGTTPEGLIGKTDLDFHPRELAEKYCADEQRIIQSGQPLISEEEPAIDAEGNKRWISTTKIPFRDAQGNITGIVGMGRDITEQKQAGEELRSSKDFLDNIITAIDDPIFVKDEEHRWVILNHAMYEFMGNPEEELLGKSAYDFFPKEEADVFWEHDEIVFTTGETDINEEEFTSSDGETHTISTKKSVFTDPITGKKYIVGAIRDITNIKQAQKELLEERNLLRTLIDSMPDPVYVKDTQSRFIVSNITNARVMGVENPNELIGKTDWDYHPKDMAVRYYADEQTLFESGQPLIDHEEPLFDASAGEMRFLATTKIPFRDSQGRVVGLVGVGRDITERKRTEEVLAKRANELEVVAQVSTAVSTILDTQNLLQTVVDLTKERFGLYHAHIYLLDEAGDRLELAAGAGEIGRQMVAQAWHIPFAQEQSLVARAARTQRGVIVNDVRREPGWLPNPLLPDTHSELAVPLTVGSRVLGVLDVQADEVDYFTEEDVRIQTTLAAQVAIAIQNAYSFEDTGTALKEVEILAGEQTVLNELGQALTTQLNVEQVLEETYRQASRLIDTSNFYVGLYDEEKHEIVFGFIVSESEIDREIKIISADQGIAGYMVRNHTSVLLEDNVREGQEALGVQLVGEEPLSWLGVPLMVGDRVIGSMAVQSFTTPRLYDEHDRELLIAIANQVAIALQNARQFEETQAALVEVQQSQALLQTIIDATPDWIFIKDREHRYRLVNQSYARSLNLTPEDFVGRNDLEVGFPEDMVKGNPEKGIRGFWTDDDEVMERGETKIIDVEPAVVDGQTRFLNTIEVPLKDAEGQVWGVLGFVHDITEREQLLAEVERRAHREQTIRQITEKMRTATSLDELVKMAAEELGEQLSVGHAVVELGIEQSLSVKD